MKTVPVLILVCGHRIILHPDLDMEISRKKLSTSNYVMLYKCNECNDFRFGVVVIDELPN